MMLIGYLYPILIPFLQLETYLLIPYGFHSQLKNTIPPVLYMNIDKNDM